MFIFPFYGMVRKQVLVVELIVVVELVMLKLVVVRLVVPHQSHHMLTWLNGKAAAL